MKNSPSELFVDGDGQPIKDGDLVQSIKGGHRVRVRYENRDGTDVLVLTPIRALTPPFACEIEREWCLDRKNFQTSAWRRVKVAGNRADVIILDDIGAESEVFTLEAPVLASHEPFTPPRAGSKGYQRRRNQRWPKGR